MAINNLITQVRVKLISLIQAINTYSQTLITLFIPKSDNTTITKKVLTPLISRPRDIPKAFIKSGKAIVKYIFYLRTRIGNYPKYNRD
jgi:hypothetical protein